MAAQVRVVISPGVQPIADEIKQVTCCSNTSEVISLMLSRYGRHFINWWVTNPHQNELIAEAISPNDEVSNSIEN